MDYHYIDVEARAAIAEAHLRKLERDHWEQTIRRAELATVVEAARGTERERETEGSLAATDVVLESIGEALVATRRLAAPLIAEAATIRAEREATVEPAPTEPGPVTPPAPTGGR